jgi:hypothetical protein
MLGKKFLMSEYRATPAIAAARLFDGLAMAREHTGGHANASQRRDFCAAGGGPTATATNGCTITAGTGPARQDDALADHGQAETTPAARRRDAVRRLPFCITEVVRISLGSLFILGSATRLRCFSATAQQLKKNSKSKTSLPIKAL